MMHSVQPPPATSLVLFSREYGGWIGVRREGKGSGGACSWFSCDFLWGVHSPPLHRSLGVGREEKIQKNAEAVVRSSGGSTQHTLLYPSSTATRGVGDGADGFTSSSVNSSR
mgnify:CR=1 FL=1